MDAAASSISSRSNLAISSAANSGSEQRMQFEANQIVDYPAFVQHRGRFKWLANAVKRRWYPILLHGEGQEHVHVVLDTSSWEHPVAGRETGDLMVAQSGWRKSQRIGRMFITLEKDMFGNPLTYCMGDETRDEAILRH